MRIISDLAGSSTVCSFAIALSSTYDRTVLADSPVVLWDLNPQGLTEPDLNGNGNVGAYKSYLSQTVLPAATTMPNGDSAADFNGSHQYLTVSSNASFSIPTTQNLTWEAWIRPDVIELPNQNADRYVSFMGKCDAPGSSPPASGKRACIVRPHRKHLAAATASADTYSIRPAMEARLRTGSLSAV